MAVEPNNCIKITAMLPPPADKIGKCQQITSCLPLDKSSCAHISM